MKATVRTGMGHSLACKTPAKINLSLRVVGRRADGYHLLDSIMVPIGVFDDLVVTLSPGLGGTVELRTTGTPEIPVEENLAFRAARLFQERISTRSHITIELGKHIPLGAGLGGGSSDAAAVLLALNWLHGAGLGADQLSEWAVELGADVPFFIHGRPARVRGIGEIVEPLPWWPRLALVVACGDAGLSTQEVYREYDLALTKTEPGPIKQVFADPQMPLHEWLVNDLETAASRIRPGIYSLKRRLMKLGALAAAMTGSGCAVFGVWNETVEAITAAEWLRAEGIWSQAVEILDGRSEEDR